MQSSRSEKYSPFAIAFRNNSDRRNRWGIPEIILIYIIIMWYRFN
ncbi:hypothetical protein ACE1CI_28285 [Aerosakkonemataceae cyanobacterium BLCC-F50]|uniref:Uncharacterized protein n=1 Tax=Floridaenema flaviceps BLCC-F50 TaxID=3153642 RepID=A0ABV4XYL9_9CYAN